MQVQEFVENIIVLWDNFEPDFLLLGKTLGAGYIL